MPLVKSDVVSGPPHTPVMLQEVLDALALRDGDVLIDGTFGAGGYTRAALAAAHVTIIAIDRDPAAILAGMGLVDEAKGRLTIVEDRFSNLDRVARDRGHRDVDAVVLDIGVSSMQLDRPERGFSFRHDGPLDMRMERRGPSAADLVNTWPEEALSRLFWAYGEEKRAKALAKAIVTDRVRVPFSRTSQLAQLCERVIRAKPGAVHPATRAFQALRIAVNHELEELAGGLLAAERVLKQGGRLVVVTFHSLEDRIVKTFLAARSQTRAGGSRHAPSASLDPPTFELIGRGALAASAAEVAANPRARSAKLRAARRTGAPIPSARPDVLPLPSLHKMERRA